MGLLVCSVFFGTASSLPRWPVREITLLALLFFLALLNRIWNLTNFPDNIST